jgi:glutaconate CoA-transferase, subunit B
MYLEQFSDFWHYAQNGRNLGIFCVGAAQLDMYGNANNSVIGSDYHAPKVRLPGTAGRGDMGSLGKRLFYWNTNHNPRSLVERVDFRSAAGYLDGGDERERLGLGPGPEVVVTNLAVLDFEPESKRMRLVSVHPGVTVEQVREATGFELLVPDGDVPETTPPTDEQVRLLREEIDPDGLCKREAGVK